MKKLRVSLSALALLLGVGAAVATTRHNEDKRWHLENGVYQEVQAGDYECIASSNICTETFDARVNPNDQANDDYPGTAQATSMESGTLVQ